jgi:hypothetical protein
LANVWVEFVLQVFVWALNVEGTHESPRMTFSVDWEDSCNIIQLNTPSLIFKSKSSDMLPFYDSNAFLMSFGFPLDILAFSTLQTFFQYFFMHLKPQWSPCEAGE